MPSDPVTAVCATDSQVCCFARTGGPGELYLVPYHTYRPGEIRLPPVPAAWSFPAAVFDLGGHIRRPVISRASSLQEEGRCLHWACCDMSLPEWAVSHRDSWSRRSPERPGRCARTRRATVEAQHLLTKTFGKGSQRARRHCRAISGGSIRPLPRLLWWDAAVM